MKPQGSRSLGCLSVARHTRLSLNSAKIAFFLFRVMSRIQLFMVRELLKLIQSFSFLNILVDRKGNLLPLWHCHLVALDLQLYLAAFLDVFILHGLPIWASDWRQQNAGFTAMTRELSSASFSFKIILLPQTGFTLGLNPVWIRLLTFLSLSCCGMDWFSQIHCIICVKRIRFRCFGGVTVSGNVPLNYSISDLIFPWTTYFLCLQNTVEPMQLFLNIL